MASGRFLPFPNMRFSPGTPETGPNHIFVIDHLNHMEKGSFGALGLSGASLLLGEQQKVNVPF